MAVYDLGYRDWAGQRASAWAPTFSLVDSGIRRAWQSRWLRRLVLFAWLPTMWFALGFFIWEQSLLYPHFRDGVETFMVGAPPAVQAVVSSSADPAAARHSAWAWLLQAFFRYPQGFLMVLVIGQIAPRLISQDIRSGAFLLYFSRPLSRGEYLAAKFLTVWFFLAVITTMPALVLYLGGVLLSPHLEVLSATWDLPLRIVGASAVLAIPTATVALWFSAMTQESRYAGFAWFATWVLGWVAYGVMTSAAAFEGRYDANHINPWSVLSPYHWLGNLQSWVFGFTDFREVRWSALIFVVVTLVSLAMLYRRVRAPLQV